jgi:hypothetical protein
VKNKVGVLIFMTAFVLSSISSVSQMKSGKPYTKQFTFSFDNDYFVMKGTDRYYTNGLYFGFDKINKNRNDKFLKRIDHIEVGQMIYKQYLRKITRRTGSGFPGGISHIDRPITGYLFAKASRSTFQKNHLWEFSVSAGTIGPLSLGQEVQTLWHRESGVGDYWDWVWDYQLKLELGINAHGKYAASLIRNPSSFIQITPVTDATIGTIFTRLSQSMVLQFGKFNKLSEGGFWNARIENTIEEANNKTELFLYVAPQLGWQLYNATVQGGMFREDKGPIVSDVEPLLLTSEVGMMVTTRRYSANLSAFFESKEAKSQFNNHSWGRVKVSYRF